MKKTDRDRQHADEIEKSQAALKLSIAETSRLVNQSEEMLRRHRKERDEDALED